MAPPQVQDINTLIGQYRTALAPEYSQIDNEVAANDQSGGAQVSGITAAKDAAFNTIRQNANDRGAYFSGFTPTEEAGYLGKTYMPALAQLQDTIAKTRSGLLEKKTGLDTQANTQALTEQNSEKQSASAYETARAAAEQKAQLAAEANATRLQAAQIGANARLNAGSNKQPTQAQIKQADIMAMYSSLQGGNKQLKLTNAGRDGYVSPQNYAAAKNAWVKNGYSASEFDSVFSNFRNPTNSYYKVG